MSFSEEEIDLEDSFERHAADESLNDSISESATFDNEPTDTTDTCAQRADDYERVGLSKPNPLEACLASLNAGMIRMADRIGGSIEESFAGDEITTDSLRGMESALNVHLRLVRQIERFAQFEARAAESRKKAENSKQKLQAMAIQQLAQDSTRRKHGLIPTKW